MKKIVRSIDVGYGQTKFIKKSFDDEISCDLFPSIAPTLTGSLLQDPLIKNTEVIKVDVGGVTRVVGKNALHFQGALSSRILDDSYSGSDPYLALTRGALFYIGEKYIDLLVVGLPVSLFKNIAKRNEAFA